MSRVLVATVRCCAEGSTQFKWQILEAGGRVVLDTAARSYPTEAEAFRAGNAAARAIIRKQVLAA